jgi:hypothetical protein
MREYNNLLSTGNAAGKPARYATGPTRPGSDFLNPEP